MPRLCLGIQVDTERERERNRESRLLKGRFQERKSIPTHLDSEGMDELSRGTHSTTTTG